ncbi:VENN motif pre-toxin domain-containing protein, partial [Bartonella sp. OC71QHHN]|uniref:VENN motif pre-toxin domain-containing protein n=2 Tax=Bartonella TaxID=773 RepID=UPI0035CF5FA3
RDHTIDVARAAGGVAAALAGGDVDAGAEAAGNAAANNYLSSAQQAQMNKELKECPDLLCEAEVSAKWSAISTGQGISFGAGIVAGVPAEIYDTVDGFVQIAKHPEETLKALKDLYTSGEILATIGRTLGQSYVDRINKMEEEYERAGAGGSFKAGFEFGKLLTETASLMTGVAGAAKGGIKLGKKALAKFAAKTETEVAKAGSEVSQLLGEINATHAEKEIAQLPEKTSTGKNEGTQKAKEHHDKIRDEVIQDLRQKGFSPSKKEITYKIKIEKNGKLIETTTRPDITYIDENGRLAFLEIKTGDAVLSENQKVFVGDCKIGSVTPCGSNYKEYLNEEKGKLGRYKEALNKAKDNFKGDVKQWENELKKFNEKWIKEQLGTEWKDEEYTHKVDRYPSYLEEK